MQVCEPGFIHREAAILAAHLSDPEQGIMLPLSCHDILLKQASWGSGVSARYRQRQPEFSGGRTSLLTFGYRTPVAH